MNLVTTINGDETIVPTVRSLKEAQKLARDYPAVLTVGPRPNEVETFYHGNHLVVPFSDVEDENHWDRPRSHHVADIIAFGRENDGELLVHCHMGISRSSASAITVLVARGVAPEQAVRALAEIHPRQFVPNTLLLSLAGDLLNEPDLARIAMKYERYDRIHTGWNPLKYAPVVKTRA